MGNYFNISTFWINSFCSIIHNSKDTAVWERQWLQDNKCGGCFIYLPSMRCMTSTIHKNIPLLANQQSTSAIQATTKQPLWRNQWQWQAHGWWAQGRRENDVPSDFFKLEQYDKNAKRNDNKNKHQFQQICQSSIWSQTKQSKWNSINNKQISSQSLSFMTWALRVVNTHNLSPLPHLW